MSNPLTFAGEVKKFWEGIIILYAYISCGGDILAAEAMGADIDQSRVKARAWRDIWGFGLGECTIKHIQSKSKVGEELKQSLIELLP
ncbi:hypothetical protein [Bacillus sp. MRMR6]|uniref:hypothetical protein n=1 Tax=Bacillus sp. MRMR6 TaxID=1928617 RepID=UPI000952A45F|nr:hypothetical protein [Bacillus sp. MRMR6]OLS34515.1 hypothetical protein BTR25_22105 [Bacillus sp. MRMR6]